jgi:hypothetical protein
MSINSSNRRWAKKVRKKNGPPNCLMARDKRILQYIWSWKIASTMSVHEAIGRPNTPYSTYKALEKLERFGMVDCRFHMSERFHVWQLTKVGFEELRYKLGDLAEEGFMSENHHHDRLVQAFQLGEWATHLFPTVLFFTEQKMRRLELENYPSWVPQTKEHKPDGYTRIVGHKRPWTLAYEVELSVKSIQRNESVLRFYKQARNIDRVLWLVGSSHIRDEILRAKASIKDESDNYHVFVDLEEFLKFGWDSQVTNQRSENLFTLREKYQGICGDIYGDILGTLQGQSTVTVHLNNSKVIGKTRS